MAQTDVPEARWRVGNRDKDVPWYTDSIGSRLGPSARKLLEEYSHIPADQVESHIYSIRDRAWQIWPYPCIGQFRFLDLSITLNPHFETLLARLKDQSEKEAQTFLDLGCCFGQDLRALVAAGAPSQKLYATDLRRDFWELGYEFFGDRETLKSRFIQGDVLEEEEEGGAVGGDGGLKRLDGKIDIIYAGSFLHLFDYEGQFKVCERVVRLLKPVPGSVVLGRQVGNVVAGQRQHRTNPEEKMFRHNVESFKKMWEEVGEKTGTRWRVEAELKNVEEGGDAMSRDPDMRRLFFTVFRE